MNGLPHRISAAQARQLLARVPRRARRLRVSASVFAQNTVHSVSQARSGPQFVLLEALRARLGESAVQSEVTGLVPGRRFRADIVIASARLVIEFDGFQYHRSKTAFQKDRERQNLFVAHGWRVLRVFNKQVQRNLDSLVEQIAHMVETQTPNGMEKNNA